MHWQFNAAYFEERGAFEHDYGYHSHRADLLGAYMAGGEL
jgi:hypothetical protein